MPLVLATLAASLLLRARSEANTTPPSTRLADCPATPNCVSSLLQETSHAIEPFTLSGDTGADWKRLQQIVESMPRTRVRVYEPGYLAVEFRSRLFGFIDDFELRLEAEGGIAHVRSASRVGYSDLGVNRRRVERIRRRLEQSG